MGKTFRAFKAEARGLKNAKQYLVLCTLIQASDLSTKRIGANEAYSAVFLHALCRDAGNVSLHDFIICGIASYL